MKKTQRTTTTILFFLLMIGVIGVAFLLNRKVEKTDTTAKKSNAANCALHFVITAPTGNPTATPIATPIVTPTPTPVPTPTPTPAPARTLTLRIKLVGVTKDVGPIAVQITDVTSFTGQLIFNHYANGVYEGIIPVSSSYVFPATATFAVKPEKHLQRVFRVWPITNTILDLTSKPFEPGDLPPQDGVVNLNDITAVISILAKPTQTIDDRNVGDVNYDGVVNAADVSAILSTLSTHPDESL